MSSDVATGLSMNGREGFIAPPPSLAALAALPALAALLRVFRGLGAARRIRNLHLGAVAQAVVAVDDHGLARGNARLDRHAVAFAGAGLDRAQGDGAVVLEHIHEGSLCAALYRRGRNQSRAAERVEQQAHVDELVGEEIAVLVRKLGFQLDRPRGRIDLVVDGEQLSGGEPIFLLAVVGLDGKGHPGTQALEHLGQAVLRDGEHHGDRLELGDDDQAVGVARPDDVARIDEAQAQAAPDRRSDGGVDELQLRIVDLALVEFHRALVLAHQRLLGVDLLLGDRILRVQAAVALDVDARVREQRLVARHLALGLGELRLISPRIDGGEHVPRLHDLAFGEGDPDELAVDPASHRHRPERRYAAQSIQVDVDVAGLRRGRDDGRGARRIEAPARLPLRSLARLKEVHRGAGRSEDQNKNDHPGALQRAPPGFRFFDQQRPELHFLSVREKQENTPPSVSLRLVRPRSITPDKCNRPMSRNSILQQDVTAAAGTVEYASPSFPMPVRQLIEGGRVPVKIFTDDLEPRARAQLANVAQLPIVFGHIAAMPDAHVGIGATVGSVIPTRLAIIPAAVGVDIGCGMNAVRLSLEARELPDSLARVRTAIERAVPVGFDEHGESGSRRDACAPLARRLESIVRKHPKIAKMQREHEKKWVRQMGSLGGGNHFIEVCLDESEHLWVMLHSGSRGIGNCIGQYFIAAAREVMMKTDIHLPDRDLGWFSEGSKLFDDYVEAVGWAQDYAFANRSEMLELILEALHRHFPAFEVLGDAINCHHNYVQREKHFGERVYVTRKGAIS